VTRSRAIGLAASSQARCISAELKARIKRIGNPSSTEAFGENRIQELPAPGFGRQLLSQFVHLFALLLWARSLLAAWPVSYLAAAIIAVIVINGLFGLWQEHRAERAVAALKKLLPEITTVRRDGRQQRVSAQTLVPGDVLVLAEGDRVSADARLVEAVDLRMDESTLTGESHPVHKAAHPELGNGRTRLQSHNAVFSGSSVLSGSAHAVVVNTGMETEFGKIAHLTQVQRLAPSPLQLEVARVARRVALLSIVMGAAFFALGYGLAGLPRRDGAIFAVGIVLANVPEDCYRP
jgi:magnesium-transporting ATPase (P-type)